VPAEAWDAAGNTHPSELLGQHFHLSEQLGVYMFQAWIWKNNSSGIFEDWNPAFPPHELNLIQYFDRGLAHMNGSSLFLFLLLVVDQTAIICLD
jgi:hypothetical protein